MRHLTCHSHNMPPFSSAFCQLFSNLIYLYWDETMSILHVIVHLIELLGKMIGMVYIGKGGTYHWQWEGTRFFFVLYYGSSRIGHCHCTEHRIRLDYTGYRLQWTLFPTAACEPAAARIWSPRIRCRCQKSTSCYLCQTRHTSVPL